MENLTETNTLPYYVLAKTDIPFNGECYPGDK